MQQCLNYPFVKLKQCNKLITVTILVLTIFLKQRNPNSHQQYCVEAIKCITFAALPKKKS